MSDQVAEDPARDWPRTEIRVSVLSVAFVLGAVLVAVVLRNLFVEAHRSIGWAVATAALAMLLTPVVDALSRRVPRIVALFATVLGIGVILGVVWAFVRIQLLDEIAFFVDEAPVVAGNLEERIAVFEDLELKDRVTDLVNQVDVPSTTQRVSELAEVAMAYFVPGILMLFMLVFGPRMVDGAYNQIAEPRRTRIRELVSNAVTDTRHLVGYKALQAVVIGVGFGVLAQILTLPVPVVLGFIAGLASVMPVIGIILGALPIIGFAAGIDGMFDAVIVIVIAVALQAIANIVIQPRLRAHSGEVGPALILIVALLANEIYGLGGAVYAIIGLSLAMSILRQLGIEHSVATKERTPRHG